MLKYTIDLNLTTLARSPPPLIETGEELADD